MACAQTPLVAQPPPAIAFDPWQAVRSDDVSEEFSATFPSAYSSPHPENQSVPIRIILPTPASSPVPVVVLLHYWGATDQRLEERIAAQFARRKIGTVLVQLPYHLSRTPKGFASGELAILPDTASMRATMLQSVWDVRRTVDFLMTRPEIDHGKIGIAGTSLGAIVAALSAGVEPRFTHLCFILGGADVAHMLWNSSRVVKQREDMRRQGYTEQRMRDELADIEPAQYLKQSAPRPSLVIAARYDTVMPLRSTNALIASLAAPEVKWMNTGHYGGVFAERSIIGALGAFFQSGFFGAARTSVAKLKLNAPTIRVGALYDTIDQLQTVAGVDLWRTNARGDVFLSAMISPRGPRGYLGIRIGQGLSFGVTATSKRVSIGAMWSIVL